MVQSEVQLTLRTQIKVKRWAISGMSPPPDAFMLPFICGGYSLPTFKDVYSSGEDSYELKRYNLVLLLVPNALEPLPKSQIHTKRQSQILSPTLTWSWGFCDFFFLLKSKILYLNTLPLKTLITHGKSKCSAVRPSLWAIVMGTWCATS